MLRTLPQVLAGRREPDFASLRAMLFYVDEFPERLHPKGERAALPKLRARAPELRAVLDELDRDHAQGERTIRELQHSLLAWEQMGESRREVPAPAQPLRHPVLGHMRREEEDVLPAALRLLTEADWDDLDQAFAQNQDPLAGVRGRSRPTASTPACATASSATCPRRWAGRRLRRRRIEGGAEDEAEANVVAPLVQEQGFDGSTACSRQVLYL